MKEHDFHTRWVMLASASELLFWGKLLNPNSWVVDISIWATSVVLVILVPYTTVF